MDVHYILGIDMGTTSVKVCILDAVSLDIVDEKSEPAEANITNDSFSSEQDVPKIMNTLQRCMLHFGSSVLSKVISIGICGQVHGIVFWNSENPPWKIISLDGKEIYEINNEISHLYTWQDGRCDGKFLSSLPRSDSHLKAYTGYGCNTLFWLLRNEPEKIAAYNVAGTIADFVVCVLCNLKRPLMSTQNAASWGYFNTAKCEWNEDILKRAGFPVHFLPPVVQPEEIAGNLAFNWCGLTSGIPVGVALGDLQCSVRAVLESANDSFMNISTSAQLAFVPDNFNPVQSENYPIEYVVPYFNNRYLAVAALINGGNALATFIHSVKNWFEDMEISQPVDFFWKRVISLAQNLDNFDIRVTPLFLSERFSPDEKASINNITPENFKLGQIFRAMCRSIISNINKLMPEKVLLDNKINRIIGSGSALIRNPCLRDEVKYFYRIPVEFKSARDSPSGAAIAVFEAVKSRGLCLN